MKSFFAVLSLSLFLTLTIAAPVASPAAQMDPDSGIATALLSDSQPVTKLADGTIASYEASKSGN